MIGETLKDWQYVTMIPLYSLSAGSAGASHGYGDGLLNRPLSQLMVSKSIEIGSDKSASQPEPMIEHPIHHRRLHRRL
jgi:hypothetical protein